MTRPVKVPLGFTVTFREVSEVGPVVVGPELSNGGDIFAFETENIKLLPLATRGFDAHIKATSDFTNSVVDYVNGHLY
jgi:hypothetical protein